MSKVVVFASSPRKNGYSALLLSKVVEGAKDSGAEVVTYDLNDKDIRGCQACFYCRSNEGCATQDALQPMYQDIKEADSIVATFPIYFCTINGQAKVWIDRMYPMINADFSPRYPGKKAVTIYSQGSTEPNAFQGAIDANNTIFKMFGWDLVKSFTITNAHNPEIKIEESMLEEAYEVGKKLV